MVSTAVVANGRYEMRVRRIGAEDTATDSMDTINWFGLKSLLPTPTSYAGITTLSMTLTGSDTIASQTENKINVVPQRKLQIVQNGAFTTTLHLPMTLRQWCVISRTRYGMVMIKLILLN